MTIPRGPGLLPARCFALIALPPTLRSAKRPRRDLVLKDLAIDEAPPFGLSIRSPGFCCANSGPVGWTASPSFSLTQSCAAPAAFRNYWKRRSPAASATRMTSKTSRSHCHRRPGPTRSGPITLSGSCAMVGRWHASHLPCAQTLSYVSERPYAVPSRWALNSVEGRIPVPAFPTTGWTPWERGVARSNWTYARLSAGIWIPLDALRSVGCSCFFRSQRLSNHWPSLFRGAKISYNLSQELLP